MRSPRSHTRRVVSLPSSLSCRPSTNQSSRTGAAVASSSAVSVVSPTRVRAVAASGAGRSATRWKPSLSRCRSAHSSSRRDGQPAPDVVIAPSSRTRAARPGAWASTMRAAVSSHCAYPDRSAPARPSRTRSVSRCSNSVAPAAMRRSRCSIRSARRRAAAPSSPAAPSPAPAPCAPAYEAASRSARSRRPVSHSAAHGGASASGTGSPVAQSNSRLSACLHGNLRLGQLHRYAGPERSITVWYGLLPLPEHSPHSAPSRTPVPDHGAGDDSLPPAFCDAASGASASTCSAVHRSPCQFMSTTLGHPTDNRADLLFPQPERDCQRGGAWWMTSPAEAAGRAGEEGDL